MTYLGSETSQWGGKPVELYRFTRGLNIWTYTTADEAIVFDGESYAPVTMRRGDLPMNDERENATLDLYMDPTIAVVADFISGASPSPTGLTLMRRHRDEAVGSEQAVLFIGQVGVCEFTEGEAHLVCVPLQKALQRRVPRWLYQTQCNHMLYDAFCGINPAAFTFPGTIGAMTGIVLTVPEASAKPDGYYNGGFLKDGETYAFIQTHVGDQITLLARSPSLALGDVVMLTAGCDRTRGTCLAKFANLPNFMGFPYIPDQNPYDGLTG